MRRFFKILPSLIILILFLNSNSDAQLQSGTPSARSVGVHRGNRLHTIFSNFGVLAQPGSQGPMLSWKYESNGYAGDISILVGMELPIADYMKNNYKDGKPDTIHCVVSCPVDRGESGEDESPDGSQQWTFEPIPGFSNPAVKGLDYGVAMSHQPETWPSYWPDHPDWIDSTGAAVWNGYFGKGVMSADQESYYWMDDNMDEKMYSYYGFLPDSTDQSRYGQGLQVKVRGMQWSSELAQDCIFWLYEVRNEGTTNYEKMSFGTLIGTLVGYSVSQPGSIIEANDDASFFNIEESITYNWDYGNYIDPATNPNWQSSPDDVGYCGYAFLESPGNKYDGIDNDGDNEDVASSSANVFESSDFNSRTIYAGDQIVLIEKGTYKRTVVTVANYPATYVSMGREFYIIPDTTSLVEGNVLSSGSINPNANDGIDNDLDGLIDENYMVHYNQKKVNTSGDVLINLFNPLAHIDYLTGTGSNDKMIDESRDDGIDNDDDWELSGDDVGADGVAGSGDIGEGDGTPTAGEPRFDQTDVEESDQIGLTSFEYFVPSTDIDISDEEDMWDRLTPGLFEVPTSIVNNVAVSGEDGDFIYGSGYFPLLAGESQYFSLGIVFGEDYDGVVRNKKIVQQIYNANYSFPEMPKMPTLSAVTGDGTVTLYWDKVAEDSYDKSLQKKDFEGYKIYKSTDPDFSDCMTISNAYGELVGYDPIAQYDLDDGVSGLFYYDKILYELKSGVSFYLGSDSGIQNTYVDTDVINGKTYYYAVCAYDQGDIDESIPPSENSKYIYYSTDGTLYRDKNTISVVPQAPVAGYVAPESGLLMTRKEGQSTVTPYVEIVDPTELKEATYILSFTDSLSSGVSFGYAYSVIDSASGEVLIDKNTRLWAENGEIFDGLRLSINPTYQALDSIIINQDESGWNSVDTSNLKFSSTQFEYTQKSIKGVKFPYDYMFVFYNDFQTRSSDLQGVFGSPSPLKAKETNFDIYDITDKDNPIKIQYGFVDRVGAHADTLSNYDAVILSNEDGSAVGWRIVFQGVYARAPIQGDTLYLKYSKPLTSKDVFSYHTSVTISDAELAEQQMGKIKVVPNPYVVSNTFEKSLSSNLSGRGERVIYFTHLPINAKINIYTSNGSHIRTLEQDGLVQDGSASWDLRTKENLDIAFGVYFYIVEAPGVSTKKFGKIAIIK